MGKWRGKNTRAVIVLAVCLLSISLLGTAVLEDIAAIRTNDDVRPLNGNEQRLSGAMNMTGPGIVWRAQLGGPIGMAISPDGTNYVTSFKDDQFTSKPELEKRDRNGGWEWGVQLGFPRIGAPVIAPDGNLRIIGFDYVSNASLIDLDPNGTVLWKFVFEGGAKDYYFLSDHPVIDDDGTSYFAVVEYREGSYRDGNNSEVQVTNSSSSLYAVSSNGQLKWKHPFNYLDTSSYFSEIAADNSGGMIYVLADNDRLSALDKNGMESWNVTFNSSYGYGGFVGISFSPTGTIYVSLGYSIWAVDPHGGLLWNRTSLGYIGQGIGIGDRGEIYVYANNNPGYLTGPLSALYSFDSNGTQLWKVDGDYSSMPIIVDRAGTVIYGTNWIVHAVDKNGSTLWTYDAGEYLISAGLDVNGRLFLLTAHALAVSNGIPKVTWIDWIVRNPVLDFVMIMAALAVIYVAMTVRRWKKNPPNEEFHIR